MTLWNNEDLSGRLHEAGERKRAGGDKYYEDCEYIGLLGLLSYIWMRKRAGEDQYHEDCEYIGLLTYHCSYLDMDN